MIHYALDIPRPVVEEERECLIEHKSERNATPADDVCLVTGVFQGRERKRRGKLVGESLKSNF